MFERLATAITLAVLLIVGAVVKAMVDGSQWGLYAALLGTILWAGYAMSTPADKRRYRRITASWLGSRQPWS